MEEEVLRGHRCRVAQAVTSRAAVPRATEDGSQTVMPRPHIARSVSSVARARDLKPREAGRGGASRDEESASNADGRSKGIGTI